MAKNTALGAKENQERKIFFKNKEHEKFYNTYLSKCPCQDTYHKTLIYCLGVSEDTRRNVNRIYDFKTGDARYFWEAIKIRYPDYCFYVDWEDMFYAED